MLRFEHKSQVEKPSVEVEMGFAVKDMNIAFIGDYITAQKAT